MARLVDKLRQAPANIADDRQLARALRDKAIAEKKYEQALKEIDSYQQQVDLLTSLGNRKGRKLPDRPAAAPKGNTATGVLILSDWHLEEPVEPAKVNGLNEYNLEIAEKRVKRVFEKAAMLLEAERRLTRIDRMVVGLLGDYISGYIHEELAEANLLSPLEANDMAADLIEWGLRYLLKHAGIKQIECVTTFDNHGRTTKKLRIATAARNSYTQAMYIHLRKYLRSESKISFNIAEGYLNWHQIEGWWHRFQHGHRVLYQGGVGGLSIPLNKAIAKWNEARVAAWDWVAHFHHFTPVELRGCVNGSLIGYNPLSVDFKCGFQRPAQTFAVVDREYGVTCLKPIFCG